MPRIEDVMQRAGIEGDLPDDSQGIGELMDYLVKLTPSKDALEAKQKIVDGEMPITLRIPKELKNKINTVLQEDEKLEA